MAYAIEKAFAGDYRYLLITVPPRHLKSFLTSICLPAFLLGHDPGARIMVASYGADLASNFGRMFRTLVQSAEYKRLFPATKLDTSRCTDQDVRTKQGGYRLAVSPTGAVTGFGADILIIDDLMKASDASSIVKRKAVRDYYEETLFTRLNNKSTGKILAIQQRLAEDDLAGYLFEKGFTHLNLKARAEEDEEFELSKASLHHRTKGEALFPEQEPLEVLERIERQIGPAKFSSQYMQRPIQPGGNMLRWEWFGTYDDKPARNELQYVVQSWDTAYSADPTANFSVCITWGFQNDRWLILDVWRRQVTYPNLRNSAFKLARDWRPDKIIIELAASGHSLFHDLTNEFSRGKVQAYSPRIGKEERFAEQTALVEDGLVLLPRSANWLEGFKNELQAFPVGQNDDQADAFSQFLDWTKRSRTPVWNNPRNTTARRNIERRNIVRRNFK